MIFTEVGFFLTSRNSRLMERLEEKDKPNSECGNYRININKEELVASLVKEWVLEWCKKYHPEAFKEAHSFVNERIDESE